jgi:cell division protein ZapA
MDTGQSEKKSVRVTIFNQTYTLRASGDPQEVQELARSVDALMDSIASRSGNTEPSRVAVLACLHMADRLRVLEQELTALKAKVDRKTEQFSSLLEQAIKGGE